MDFFKEILMAGFRFYLLGAFIFAGFIVVSNPLIVMNKHQRGKSMRKTMKEKISLWNAFIWPVALISILKALKGKGEEEIGEDNR